MIKVRYFPQESECILLLDAVFEFHELQEHVGEACWSFPLLRRLHLVTASSNAKVSFSYGLQLLVFLKGRKGFVGQLSDGS